jgi:hypothetical protein
VALPKCTETEFIALWKEHKSAKKISDILQCDVRSVQSRRKNIEAKLGYKFDSLDPHGRPKFTTPEDKIRCNYEIQDGVIVVASDAHYWPGYVSTAHRGFVEVIKRVQPNMVILNGDIFDGHSVSRHGRISWQDKGPTVKEELEAVQERLSEIEAVRPAGCILHRTIGNHDSRFEGKLANDVPQYEGVFGTILKDHLPAWSYSWSVMVNNNCMIKHRWHNGIHAVYNNILKSGTSMVTGHLHSLKVTPWTDYTGDRYGVDTGTLSALGGPQFLYLEDSPVNWRAGFAVLTFRDGKLLPPELAQVISEDDGLVYFRGEVIEV